MPFNTIIIIIIISWQKWCLIPGYPSLKADDLPQGYWGWGVHNNPGDTGRDKTRNTLKHIPTKVRGGWSREGGDGLNSGGHARGQGLGDLQHERVSPAIGRQRLLERWGKSWGPWPCGDSAHTIIIQLAFLQSQQEGICLEHTQNNPLFDSAGLFALICKDLNYEQVIKPLPLTQFVQNGLNIL